MRRLLVLAALAACSKRAPDECDRFVERSAPAYASLIGKPVDGELKARLAAQCREGLRAGHRDPALDCVLAAKDDLAVRACYQQNVTGAKPKSIAAKRELQRIGKAAKAAFVATNAFPKGTAPLTPATACCAQPNHVCAAADWSAAPWQALGFAVTEPGEFQYSYESDGATFTATAVGDPGCAGAPVTYLIEGSAPDGNPQVREEMKR